MNFERKHVSVVEKPISGFSRAAYLLPVFLLLGCDALNPWRTLSKTIERSEFHPVTTACLSMRAREMKFPADGRNVAVLAQQSVWMGLTLYPLSDGFSRVGEAELRCVMNFLRHETSESIRTSPLVKQENCTSSQENPTQLRCVDRIVVRFESIESRYKYVDYTVQMILVFSPRKLENGTIERLSRSHKGAEWDPPTLVALSP
jgi:hypothetical protein